VRAKIRKARKASIASVARRIAAEDHLASREAVRLLGCITQRDLLMLGLGLYLGEGDKGGKLVSVSNSDPDTLALALHWMLGLPGITRANIAVRVHIYPDLDESVVRSFWSKKLGIPLRQFGACVVDRRVKKMVPRSRKLFFGTAHLIIRARGNPQHGRYLARVMRELLKVIVTQG
jgi:hypothetical protein